MRRLRYWARRWFVRGVYDQLTGCLYANDAALDNAYFVMSGRADGSDRRADLLRIVALREQRVDLLRRLGRHAEARRLANETAERRRWIESDSTVWTSRSFRTF